MTQLCDFALRTNVAVGSQNLATYTYADVTNLLTELDSVTGDEVKYTCNTDNLRGDVTGIVQADGTTVVTYTYDAWGNILSTTGTLASTLGTLNPLRYRGYVYDQETNLYYLQSRYYDPEIGRFINADGLVSTGQGLLGNNMFAYCNNNPIMFVDPTGQAGKLTEMLRNLIRRAFNHVFSDPEALPYVSATEAAEVFFEEIYASSAYIRHEFYAKVHVKYIKGVPTYGLSEIKPGATHSCYSLNEIPDNGMKVVAYVHTHPNENEFSLGDKERAVDNKIDAYVVGPNLMMQRHSWQTNETQQLYRVSPTPLTTAQESSLVLQFRDSWNLHISVITYPDDEIQYPCSCADLPWPAW